MLIPHLESDQIKINNVRVHKYTILYTSNCIMDIDISGINGELAECHIRGIAVTTFGVDGALVDKQGNLLYPIISWKCPRTAAVMENIGRLISAQKLQAISGINNYGYISTINF